MNLLRRLSRPIRVAAMASVSLLAFPATAQTVAAQTAAPAEKPLKAAYGNLKPFYGNLKPFYGNLKPFYGNLKPFWGNLKPFWGDSGAFYGDLNAFWATPNPQTGKSSAPAYPKIADFWITAGARWDRIDSAWDVLDVKAAQGTATAADYSAVGTQLEGLIQSSGVFWGEAVKAGTKKSFQDGFAAPLLAKYGLNPADPRSLSKLDRTDRAMFFLEWYDGLMNFSGTDHVDHWMRTVNWTPALTKTQGYGQGTIVGLLDFAVVGDKLLQKSIATYDGVSNFTNGHGTAVASLIVGAHDGQGVMGIAPKATVIAYNPFDASGTAGWADVTAGVSMLTANGASIVNMSLGVPGKTLAPGWNAVFSDPTVASRAKNTVFVIAAGNEGAAQSQDIPWSFATNPSVIVVGSVDFTGDISNFSNRPGSACLVEGDVCKTPLKTRFVVAPGEMLLVSNDKGGVVRETGTSVAAPLVSGAIALLHDRWPWLAKYPTETADIILRSARDLGAPGPDEVYGMGLLDVTASQSPLSFNRLKWFTIDDKGKPKEQTQSQVISTYRTDKAAGFSTKGAYFYAFETIGNTTRDFAIPLSQKLVGQSVKTFNGANEQFQSYLLARLDDWAGAAFVDGSTGRARSNPLGLLSSPVPNPWGADLSLSIAPRPVRYGFQTTGPAFQSTLRLRGERYKLAFGYGDGAPAVAGLSGLSQAADYDGERGGANPLLGLASGGGFVTTSLNVSDRVQLSAGALGRDDRRDAIVLPQAGVQGSGAARYAAAAQHVGIDYRVTDEFHVLGAYTRLHEASGLLGLQSLDAGDLRHGSTTDGATLGFAWTISSKMSLAGSGTLGRTRSAGSEQGLSPGSGGLVTSAYEFGLTAADLLVTGDTMRLTLSQPMSVERGALNISGVQVIDRETGELGVQTQSFDVSGARAHAAEFLYARPLSGGRAVVSLFGRLETQSSMADGQSYIGGARYRLAF